ncbi:MAG: hypothetical protein HQM15_11460 [Deltaproteobacteria bacterium]|nr:hypothetical protein [Deltaproteobacteria bacterium]
MSVFLRLQLHVSSGAAQTNPGPSLAPSANPLPSATVPSPSPVSTPVSPGANSQPARSLASLLGQPTQNISTFWRRNLNPARPLEGFQRYVPLILEFMNHIRALDLNVHNLFSNLGQDGTRHSEFRQDGTSDPNGATVSVERNTRVDINISVRPDRNLDGEPVLNHFSVGYLDDHDPTRRPLDISGRTPMPLGSFVLSLRGFFGMLAGVPLPDREDFDPMDPRPVPLDGSVAICQSVETCLWVLRYSFNGIVEGVARENIAGFINGFWPSQGFDRNFYREHNLPTNTMYMRLRDFVENIAAAYLWDFGQEYRRTHTETGSPNPPLISGPLESMRLDVLSEAHAYPLPDGSQLELDRHNALRTETQNAIRSLSRQPEHETQDERELRESRLNYYRTLALNFGRQNSPHRDPASLNHISFSTQNSAFYDHGNQFTRLNANQSHLQVYGAALSFSSPDCSPQNQSFNFRNFIADEVHVIGPSLMDLIRDLGTDRWTSETPIQIRIARPSFRNFHLDTGNLRLDLNECSADQINIRVPSLHSLARIMGTSPSHPFSVTELANHWQELLAQCEVQMDGIHLNGNFEIEYRENNFLMRGFGGRINHLNLTALDLHNPELLRNLEPLIHDYRTNNPAHHRIPKVSLDEAIFRNIDVSFRNLGHIHAQDSLVRNYVSYFPYNQIATLFSEIHMDGSLNYNSQGLNPTENTSRAASTRRSCPDTLRSGSPTIASGSQATQTQIPTQTSPTEATRTNFVLQGNSNVRNVQLRFDLRQEGIARYKLDCDVDGNIQPGSVAFLNEDISIDIGEDSAVEAMHLQSHGSFGRGNNDQALQHRTLFSGAMRLNLVDGHIDLAHLDLPLALNAQLQDISASSNDACAYVSNDEIHVAGRSNFGSACNLDDFENAPDPTNTQLPQLATDSPIQVSLSLTHSALSVRQGLPFSHNDLAGTLALGLNRLIRRRRDNGEAWEADLREPRISDISGMARATLRGQNYQVLLQPQEANNPNNPDNHLEASRINVIVGIPNSPQSPIRLEQFLIQGLDISLNRENPNAHLILQLPYFRIWQAAERHLRFWMDLPHSNISAAYPGAPRIFWGAQR